MNMLLERTLAEARRYTNSRIHGLIVGNPIKSVAGALFFGLFIGLAVGIAS